MVIKVDKLTKRFGDFTAVDSISFDVPQGQIFGFLGPNGSGKTTTIKMLLGLQQPTSGTAQVLGRDVSQQSRDVRRELGYMSQKFSLYGDLTAHENLRFFGQSYDLYGKQLQMRMDAVIEMAGLRDYLNVLTDDLAGGWAQRLALAAAVIHQPKLLFLDEPTAGVDPISRREFWNLLYDLAQAGTTIFVTTHYMDEAEHCERLAFIYTGKIIATGAPHEIITQHVAGDVIVFEPSDPIAAKQVIQVAMANGTLAANSVSLFGAAVHVITEDVERTIGALQQMPQIELGDWWQTEPTLEDAFIALVSQSQATT